MQFCLWYDFSVLSGKKSSGFVRKGSISGRFRRKSRGSRKRRASKRAKWRKTRQCTGVHQGAWLCTTDQHDQAGQKSGTAVRRWRRRGVWSFCDLFRRSFSFFFWFFSSFPYFGFLERDLRESWNFRVGIWIHAFGLQIVEIRQLFYLQALICSSLSSFSLLLDYCF